MIAVEPAGKNSYQPLLRILLAAVAGILADHYFNLPFAIWFVVAVTGLIIWFQLHRRQMKFDALCLSLTIACLSGCWHHIHWNLFSVAEIGQYAKLDSEPAAIQGTVVSRPKWAKAELKSWQDDAEFRTRFLVRTTGIRNGNKIEAVDGLVQLFVSGKVEHLSVGDSLQLIGKLKRIPPASNPGQFDFQDYFRGQRTLCWMNVEHPEAIQSIGPKRGNLLDISGLQFQLDALLWRYLPEHTAPLASAMLLGNRDQLDTQQREGFMLTGTVHLLAISGLHVGILASLFLMMPSIGLLPRKASFLITMLFVLLYAWLVEFRPPVVRAAVLISVFCYCSWIGRAQFSFNSLALAALIVLIVNPTQLFGTGAQLSFLAVGSLIFASTWLRPTRSLDPIDRLIEQSRTWREKTFRRSVHKIVVAFAASAIIWTVAFPLVAFRFHIMAPIALLANPLLLLPITSTLICGFGILIFGAWFPWLAGLCASGCHGSLQAITWTVETSEGFSWGHWWTAGPSVIATAAFYLLVVIAFIGLKRVSLPTFMVGIAAWLMLGWLLPNWLHDRVVDKRQDLACFVIDVGHGGCVLLELPENKNILYDCGSYGSSKKAADSCAAVLWHRGIRFLDVVVISHADSDHLNGIQDLLDKFAIGQIWVPPHMLSDQSRPVRSLLSAIQAKQIPVQVVTEQVDVQQLLDAKGVQLTVLNPPAATHFETASDKPESDNSLSIVLSITYRQHRMLLTGDLENQGLQRLLDRPTESYDVVMAPHHGSLRSRPTEFLAWCQPQAVIVSSGRGKNESWPTFAGDETEIYHTGRNGAVQVRMKSAGDFQISRWLDGTKL